MEGYEYTDSATTHDGVCGQLRICFLGDFHCSREWINYHVADGVFEVSLSDLFMVLQASIKSFHLSLVFRERAEVEEISIQITDE